MPVLAFGGSKSMLDNKSVIISEKRDFTKTVTITIFVKGGSARETKANNGIGSLFANTWTKSSKLLEELEFYGGVLSAGVSPDFIEFSLSMPSEHFDKVKDDVVSFFTKPVFKKEVFEREKSLQLESIKASMDNPQSKAFKAYNAATYKDSPYELSSDGDKNSVNSITYEDVKNYHKTLFKGSNLIAAVAGNYDSSLMNSVKKILLSFEEGEQFSIACADTVIKKDERIEDDDPRFNQAKLFVGYTAPGAGSEDYAVLKVVSEILGGGMSSRYFTELRKNRGYAYAVSAFYPSRLCSSRFTGFIGLDYKNAQDAIDTMEEINSNLHKTITDEEIQKVKNYILGRLLIDTQTNSRRAWHMCFFENLGLGYDYLEKHVERLKTIDKDKVREVLKLFEGHKTIYILK